MTRKHWGKGSGGETCSGCMVSNLPRMHRRATDDGWVKLQPHFLHRNYTQVSRLCIRGEKENWTCFHCIWPCLLIRIGTILQKILDQFFTEYVAVDPALGPLSVPMRQLALSSGRLALLCKLLLLARWCLLLQWNQEKTPLAPPSVTQQHQETLKLFPIKHLSSIFKGNISAFHNMWQPFLDYLLKDLVHLLQKGNLSFVFTNQGKEEKSHPLTWHDWCNQKV